MAQLKDTVVAGDLSVTGTIYGDVPLNDLTDADDLKAIEALTGTSGILTKTAANTWSLSSGATPASHTHGKITNDGKIANADNVAIANGDRLIISDSSDSYILKNTSITFDGSTETKALTQKGTWATFAANNHNHDSIYLKLTGGSLSGRLTMTSGKPINQILTGSGTAATSTTTDGTTTYFPAKWTFNTGLTVTDGDIYTIKVPVAGHDNGVFVSINNGTNYYPLIQNGTSRITTHYAKNVYVQVIFQSAGSATSIYPLAGGTARVTVSGGAFRVLNFYDSGNTNTLLRTYKAYNSNIELPLISGSTDSTSPAAPTGETGYADLYGQIPKTAAKRATYNLSTGKITVPGGVIANGITASSGSNIFIHSSGTKGTNPSSTISSSVYFQDTTSGSSNTTRLGLLQCYVNTSGTAVNSLYAYDWTASSTKSTNLQVVHEKGADAGYVQISGQPKTAAILRNISYSTGVPASTDGKLGQVHIQYTTNSKPEIFPVGAVYLSINSTNPSSYFAGTWEQIAAGRALFGAGTLGGITYTAGNTVDAGLPNITGKVVRAYSDFNSGNTDYNQYTTGPFYITDTPTGTTSNVDTSGSYDGIRNIGMDLSRANSIYGNSTTVQPPAFVIYVWKRTA